MIKGILIFLIVLGHNMVFTLPLIRWGAMSYLYTFHIDAFFLLPFLYGSRPLTWANVRKNVVRLYWPFLLLAGSLSLFVGFQTDFAEWTPERIFRMLVMSDVSAIRSICGVAMLWFLPTMLSLMLLRDWYYQAGVIIKGLLLVCSILLNILPYIWQWVDSIGLIAFLRWCPLGLPSALRFLIYGVCLRWGIERIHRLPFYVPVTLFSIIYIWGTYLYFTEVAVHWNRDTECFFLLKKFMPLVTLGLLYMLCTRWAAYATLITRWGHQSMKIYLISPFLGYIVYYLLRHLHMVNWYMGLISQVVIFSCAYGIATSIFTGRVASLITPRSENDLRSAFSSFS